MRTAKFAVRNAAKQERARACIHIYIYLGYIGSVCTAVYSGCVTVISKLHMGVYIGYIYTFVTLYSGMYWPPPGDPPEPAKLMSLFFA